MTREFVEILEADVRDLEQQLAETDDEHRSWMIRQDIQAISEHIADIKNTLNGDSE